MRRYLVGGAVRDALLGQPSNDRDWLVLGTTAEALTTLGYRQVGRSFPVYLDPERHEEHALPRGVPGGTSGDDDGDLLTDLARRDFTVNAMARDAAGDLHDPFGGAEDLAARRLRHVSSAHFGADPIRILRGARLAARLTFDFDPGTLALMRALAASGALTACSAERLYTELAAGLAQPSCVHYIRLLRENGALAAMLPEVNCLFGVPQPVEHHPEVDTGEHLLLALAVCVAMDVGVEVRIAVLLHDVGKGLTPPSQWPRHRGHEVAGRAPIAALAERLRLPAEVRELALLVARHHLDCHRIQSARPGTILRLLEAARALGQGSRLEPMLAACEADARGRAGLADRPYPQARYLRGAAAAAAGVTSAPLIAKGLCGAALGQALRTARLEAIARYRRLQDPAAQQPAGGEVQAK